MGLDMIYGEVASLFETSAYLTKMEQTFISRAPGPVASFGNLTKPFSTQLWMAICMTIAAISFCVFIAHSMYTSLGLATMAHPEPNQLNFILFPFCKVTEPEPLPWFSRGSGGHFLVFLWTILALLLVMCYQCNLRANLISVEYQKPIDTLQDVLTRSTKIWIGEVTASTFV